MSITTRSKRNLDLASKATAPTVGPGSYETNDNGIVMKDDSPYPFLTTAARFKDVPNLNPSPADYHPEIPTLNIKCVAASTMRSVTPRKGFETIDSPDPCLYQNLPKWSYGMHDRNGQRRPRMPFSSRSPRDFGVKPDHDNSPSDFNIRMSYDRGVVIPKSTRPAFKPNANPGPGAYEVTAPRSPRPHNKLPSHQFLTSGERNIFPVSDSIADRPGLGHEDWRLPTGFAPFGSKARKQNFWASKKTPGPGAYNTEKDRRFTPNNAPFGVRGPRNWQEPNDNPGPGSYKMDGKRKFKDNPDVPFNQRSPRQPFWGGGNPVGPGAYDVDKQQEIKALKKLESPSPSFLTGGDRNPFKGDPTVPGPGKYSPEVGESISGLHKLKRCMDGSERYKEGTFIGQPINDAPGPATYNPERKPSKRIGDPGGYWPHSERGSWVRNTCAPSMEKYNVAGDMLKPSLNVTYSVCKL